MRTHSPLVTPLLLVVAIGCTTSQITKIGTGIAADKGLINEEQKKAIERTEEAFRRSFEDLTEEEEYYIGRAVAATILARYSVYRNNELERYLNRVGRAVSLASSRPEIFHGYHFLVLDTEEINAFAAPGGFIFITRGMLGLVPDEETLAAVLAHEVAHVAGRHGLAAIQKSRLMDAFAILGREAGAAWNREELLKLTDLFDGAVGDVVRTLVEKGYGRGQEEEADRMAVQFASAVGYQPDGLTRFLEKMEKSVAAAGGLGMFRTHPPAGDRKASLGSVVAEHAGEGTDPTPRGPRFRKHLAVL